MLGTALARLWVLLLSPVLCFQMTAGAMAFFLCTHADGSQRIETIAQQAECHTARPSGSDSRTTSIAAADCTDQTITTVALTARPSNDQQRIEPLLLTIPLWPHDVLTLSTPATRRVPSPSVDHVPAAEQHALLLSAVVLLI